VGGIAPPRLNSTARRDDTRIRFLTHKDATVIDIASGFGIDRAVISRETDDWPKPLVVRLHLRGLESFQAMAGDITVKWSMSAIGDSPARVTLRHGSAETPLDEASPYFTEPRYFAAERGVPLKDDYFEVSLPPKVFEGNPGKVTLAWVDFFRG
jgi:hypothetical protein